MFASGSVGRCMATASALRNWNICQFYGASEPHMFIVSELMEGGDLKCAIERDPVNMAWNKRGRQARERAAASPYHPVSLTTRASSS